MDEPAVHPGQTSLTSPLIQGGRRLIGKEKRMGPGVEIRSNIPRFAFVSFIATFAYCSLGKWRISNPLSRSSTIWSQHGPRPQVAPTPWRKPRFKRFQQPVSRKNEAITTHSSALKTPPATSSSIHDQQLRISGLGDGNRRMFECVLDGRQIQISYDVFVQKSGMKTPTLFLATPSFVPSRATFADLATAILKRDDGQHGIVPILTELPGYGLNDGTLKELNAFRPQLFRDFLKKFFSHLAREFGTKVNVISAGHAAFYVLDVVKDIPDTVRSLFLVNPTYRGPLTTVKMKNENSPLVPGLIDTLCGGIAAAYNLPAPIGNAVHATQCSESSIRKAMLSHVFQDPANVTPEAVEVNRQFAAQGERWGKCAFLIGLTDPYPRREDAVASHGAGAVVPTALCVGAKEEKIFREDLGFLMESEVPMIVTPGAQRNFVEYPEAVATAAMEFLSRNG